MRKKKKGYGWESTEGNISKSQIKERKEKSKLVADCEDRLLRLQAEFENYKKQLDREKGEFMLHANELLIKDLLNVLDDFERAIDEMKKDKNVNEKISHGFELIYKNLLKILEQHGLKPIDALGKKFDPYYHEALLQEDSEKEDGIILEELQKGYLLNNKVIRHSKVKVSISTEKNKNKKNG